MGTVGSLSSGWGGETCGLALGESTEDRRGCGAPGPTVTAALRKKPPFDLAASLAAPFLVVRLGRDAATAHWPVGDFGS